MKVLWPVRREAEGKGGEKRTGGIEEKFLKLGERVSKRRGEEESRRWRGGDQI